MGDRLQGGDLQRKNSLAGQRSLPPNHPRATSTWDCPLLEEAVAAEPMQKMTVRFLPFGQRG
jgi:hypothetical protein